MSYIKRQLNLEKELAKKSVLLVGARQTGKSSLIRHSLKSAKKYNLLESDTFVSLQRNPAMIRQQLTKNDSLIVVDEIQKIPDLLDEVHLMIEEFGVRFLLTGSSLRRFSQKGINRLGGRLRTKYLLPFSVSEIGLKNFNLEKILNYGLIPSVHTSDTPWENLKDYLSDYIKAEIIAEGAIRNIPAFGRFLEVAAINNGEMLQYSNISNDAQVARTTIMDYYKVLTHTLIGHELLAWKETKKRKPISTSKFYIFDTGVINVLLDRKNISLNNSASGTLFETFIFHELMCFNHYQKEISIHYWRSTSGFEVDFIVNEKIAIECKLTKNVTKEHLKGLKALKEENKIEKFYLICQEKQERVVEGIFILPVCIFLNKLWSKDIV